MATHAQPSELLRERAIAAREQLLDSLPVRERKVEIAGIVTALLEGGEGPPLILLHGPGEFAGAWMRVIPQLVSTHRVIAPDLPGHGSSAAGRGALDTDRVMEWLGALIDETCPSPPILVGHLLGGAIAARFAARYGDRLAQLVLVDSLGLAPFRPAPKFAFTMMHFMVRPSERTYDRFMKQCSLDLDELRDQMGERWEPFAAYNVASARNKETKSALRALMREVGLPTIPHEELARIDVPTALVWGRHDRANRLRVAETASARYKWPLHVIEESADDPGRDQPAVFVDVLRHILRDDEDDR